MKIAFFRLTVFGADGYEKEHFDFDSKAAKFYELIARGYKRDDLEKRYITSKNSGGDSRRPIRSPNHSTT